MRRAVGKDDEAGDRALSVISCNSESTGGNMATFDVTDQDRNIALQALRNFKLAHGQRSAGASEQSPENSP